MLLSLLRAGWQGAHYLCLLALLTLSFDISKDCGLSYSLWLFSYYVALLLLRRPFLLRGPFKAIV